MGEWGSPFLVEVNGSALYVWRYGESADDPDEGIAPPRGRWLIDQIFHGPARDQGVLDFPNLSPIPLARVAVLAYAGNRPEGLVRALIGLPYLDTDGCVSWREREDLDLDAGRQLFGLPGISDDELPPRHSFVPGGRVFLDAPQPALDLELLDEDAGLDLGALFVDTSGEAVDRRESVAGGERSDEDVAGPGPETDGNPT